MKHLSIPAESGFCGRMSLQLREKMSAAFQVWRHRQAVAPLFAYSLGWFVGCNVRVQCQAGWFLIKSGSKVVSSLCLSLLRRISESPTTNRFLSELQVPAILGSGREVIHLQEIVHLCKVDGRFPNPSHYTPRPSDGCPTEIPKYSVG